MVVKMIEGEYIYAVDHEVSTSISQFQQTCTGHAVMVRIQNDNEIGHLRLMRFMFFRLQRCQQWV